MHNSKKALFRILLILLIVIGISLPILYPYFSRDIYYYQDRAQRQGYAGQLDTLIVGSSEGLRGLDPTQIDHIAGTTTYNISAPMMTMCGRYRLLKHEISRNPIQTVVLELSYESMARNRKDEGPEGDLSVLGRWDTPWQCLSFILEAFPVDEIPWLYYDCLDRGMQSIRMLRNGDPTGPYIESINRRGFLLTPTQDVSLPQSEYLRSYHSKSLDTTIDPYNVEYLEKISALCKENGIQLVIVTLPQAKSYTTEYSNLQVMTDYYRNFAAENGWYYYDFNLWKERDTQLPEDEAFNDATHLSHYGSLIATQQLTIWMGMEAAGEDTSALFYSTHEEVDHARGYIREIP